MQHPRCLVLGSVNIDEFYAVADIVKPGQTISSTSFTRKAGGKGANQAYAVAQSGALVTLDACIGPDGLWIKDSLERSGVDVSLLRVMEEEVTGRAIIQLSQDGENSIVLHKGANYAQRTTLDLTGFSHLLIQNEIPLKHTASTVREAKRLGLVTVFNPSPMLTSTEFATSPLASIDWLLVNEGELEELLKMIDLAGLIDKSPLDKCWALHEKFQKISIICTLGSNGLVYLDSRSETPQTGHQPCGRLQQPVRNTTGAGDCFTGYFVSGLMAGQPLPEVLMTCVTACALCVEVDGAMESIPHVRAVRDRLSGC